MNKLILRFMILSLQMLTDIGRSTNAISNNQINRSSELHNDILCRLAEEERDRVRAIGVKNVDTPQ